MQIRKGGAWRTIKSISVFANGAWRTVTNGSSYHNGRWRQVCNFTGGTASHRDDGPMSLAMSLPTFAAFSHNGSDASKVETATPTGGRSPYSYAWSFTYNSGGCHFDVTNLSSVTVFGGDGDQCNFKCICTDSLGSTATAIGQGVFSVTDFDLTSTL